MPHINLPKALVKTWLDIYYSREISKHAEAQRVVKALLLKNFYSLYEAEMYLRPNIEEIKPRST
jgi:hypothetical protein|tara:strand:- start:6429 stop:6620 length:192 start_codon:yes stop_codon:yes gene_type:complete